MNKFNLRDIIDLAKAGYKPNEVKELLELGNTIDDEESQNNADDLVSVSSEDGTASQVVVESNDSATTNEETVDNIDYKKLYEDSQNELKAIQKENRNINIDDNKKETAEDILKDAFASFM